MVYYVFIKRHSLIVKKYSLCNLRIIRNLSGSLVYIIILIRISNDNWEKCAWLNFSEEEEENKNIISLGTSINHESK